MAVYTDADACVLCGAYVPEGTMVCPCCMVNAGKDKEKEECGWSPSHTTNTTSFWNFLRR